MTGDVDEECSLLQISQDLVDSVPPSGVSHADSASFASSTVTVDDGCLYTATVPAEITDTYPEGTILQMLPSATLVTLPLKCLSSSNNSSAIIFKGSYTTEAAASPTVLANLLTGAADNCENQTANVDGNISDIDLSFLTETEVTSAISDPKILNENAVQELQGMIAEVSQESLSLLQNNLSIPESVDKSTHVLEQPNQDSTANAGNPTGDIVMIDVSKPIQLAQNSLIMVNGQKCVLQQDPQTGQVVAYPVKEQDKPRRKRGRPRKTSLEQQAITEMEQSEASTCAADEETEKGLLEIVNDDGSLVRRSSRKRKKNKVLKDYETGNLQQELGSDEEDPKLILEREDELGIRKKKVKGPGRPRKYPKPLDDEATLKDGTKRPRGRPRKQNTENEPSQAFLVQTADGQVLMMQVPLSSIPQNMTLQEMAEQIACKLNENLNQPTVTYTDHAKDSDSQPPEATSFEIIKNNSRIESEAVAKNLIQDHSIGSTTNFLNLNQSQQATVVETSVEAVENICQNVMKNVSSIIVDSVGQVAEVVIENNNCSENSDCSTVQNLISESILDHRNSLNSLNIPESRFCENISNPSNSSVCNSSFLCNVEENGANQFCSTKSRDPNLSDNFEQVEEIHSTSKSETPGVKSEILKEKVDFQLFMQNGSEGAPEVPNIQFEELLNNNNPELPVKELPFQKNHGKENSNYSSELINNFNSCSERQLIANFHSYYQTRDNFDCETVGPDTERINVKNFQPQTGVESEDISQNSILESSETGCIEDNKSIQFSKTESDYKNLDILLKIKETFTETLVTDKQNVSSNCATSVIAVPEKVFPIILPALPNGSKCCRVCKAPYSTDEEIIEHFKSKHPRCICSECDYMAEQPYVIKRHFYRHTNQPCVCTVCHKSYKDLYILKMHVKMVHLPPEVMYTCDLCEKCFTRKAHLKRHMRIHEPVKQYHCPHCQYQGCEKSDLNKHMLIHGDPKYMCDVCGKAFRHMKNRDLHVKRHSGQRDYKCGVCNFYGYTFTDIRKHIERRHKNAACKDCETVFNNPETLEEHKLSGTCPGNKTQGIKVEEIKESEDSKEASLLDDVPPEILESDQVFTVKECSEETLSMLQNRPLVMTSVDGILNGQAGQLVLQGLEECSVVTSESLSVISSENNANKSLTLVTSDGRNLSFSLQNCSLPLETNSSNEVEEQENCEQIIISSEIAIPS